MDNELEQFKEFKRIVSSNVGDDMISKLLDVENKQERSNSPVMQIVLWQLYIRRAGVFLAKHTGFEELKQHCEDWADCFSSGMIGYKTGSEGGRVRMVTEALKKAPESVQVLPQAQQPEKRPLFSRGKKEDDKL